MARTRGRHTKKKIIIMPTCSLCTRIVTQTSYPRTHVIVCENRRAPLGARYRWLWVRLIIKQTCRRRYDTVVGRVIEFFQQVFHRLLQSRRLHRWMRSNRNPVSLPTATDGDRWPDSRLTWDKRMRFPRDGKSVDI